MTALEGLIALIESWTGICLARGGAAESLRRFAEARTKDLGLASIDAYLERLAVPGSAERELLVNAVTVNYTWFYRDAEQMSSIARLLREGFGPGVALRIWVAGCATGEDAYTLAMLAQSAGREAFVLGTDLNSSALAAARAGWYGPWSTRELPAPLARFFGPPGRSGRQVTEEVARRVTFEQHNLIDPPRQFAADAGWDLILCRNVLIYFGRAAAELTRAQLGSALAPGGWLLVGAAETIWQEPPGLRLVHLDGRAVLHRPVSSGAAAPAALVAQAAPPPPARAAPAPAPKSLEPLPDAGPQSGALDWVDAGARLMTGDLVGAVSCFTRARELEPLSVEAHLHLGIAFHLLGDAVSAVAAFRTALLLRSSLWPAAFYLALSFETLGRPDDARREYQRVLDTHPLPTDLSPAGVLRDMEAWKPEMLALAKRRAAPRLA